MLKILTLGSMDEQSNYVSTWLQIISVCAQELKHGSLIWKQSLEKDVRLWILSQTRGKRFILALGEIYRVVVVLGASAKLYKPWILSSSVDSAQLNVLFEECHALWSSSGLKEALLSISDPIGSEYFSTVEALTHSIEYVYNLDALALANLVFKGQEAVCQLSALTAGVVPGMKMVIWNGERYFLTLANLWANLISCDPPKLPLLHVG
ncbi:unnamed protein product [Ilex paraguariensis]|uniref:Synergin gamma C-terminal domain-containing protein n=1 Tax=Ilex paraguariensis TaxID=185542 RepID=A0ABC8SSE0_9AQUA